MALDEAHSLHDPQPQPMRCNLTSHLPSPILLTFSGPLVFLLPFFCDEPVFATSADAACLMYCVLHCCLFTPFHSLPASTRATSPDETARAVQGANRGGVSNIARTAAKLPPFAFNDARLAGAPPLSHLMQTHVRGVPQSKQLTPAVQRACQQDRQSLCDVCRKPYQSSPASGAPGGGRRPRACQPCAQWVMPSDGSDSDGPGGAGARVNGSAGDTGVSLAWLADAMPRLELG